MSSIPSNLGRVSNLLTSQVMLSSLTRTNQELLQQQIRLSTGKLVNRASDDAVAASTISVLDDIIERRDQRLRNLSHADAVLNNVDAALGDLSDLLIEARAVGLSQIGVGSDTQTRENQAEVINAFLSEALAIGNRQFQDIFYFGGSATANPPMEGLLNGIRYAGNGSGLLTDLGVATGIPITMSADEAFGALSTRVEGDRDLDPIMTAATRLVDLNGARGLGISLGSINVDVNGTDLTVDLTSAHTIGDVISTLQTAIQTVDAGATVSIDPATDNRLLITPSAGMPVTITDSAADAAAADLGIAGLFPGGAATAGSDLDPRLTEVTALSSLTGVTVPLGTIRLSNAGQSRDLDLSGAQTVQDVINAVRGLNIGIRVEVNEAGDRLNFVNELSGSPDQAMSIAEVGGGTTATELGVRSLAASTLLSDFNDGLGVSVISGAVDPITGLPDPAADLDFRVTLKDGRTFDVDLSSAQATVQDVLDVINAAAATAGVIPADFTAALAADGNGLEFTDNTVGGVGATFSIGGLNGSHAAEDLGIQGSTTGATFTGSDRATVAVDSVFSHLIALRDALRSDDERGISLATQRLETDLTRATQSRAIVGVRSQRVTAGVEREQELMIQDTSLRSQVQDLDFTEAATRFAQLQQQLQAGLATASRVTSMSLLDFLR